jgi:hypothetical protein
MARSNTERPTPDSIARYVKRNSAQARKALKASHSHHPKETLREVEYHGHRIVIGTTYRIAVDGQPVGGHFIVTDEGQVQCHALPNYTFASAVDLVKSMIDIFPDDFPPRRVSGRRRGTAAPEGEGHGGH